MKLLSSFMVMNAKGGDRVSFTFDDIDDATGEARSENNKRSFFVVDSELESHIEAIRDFIRDHKLDGLEV